MPRQSAPFSPTRPPTPENRPRVELYTDGACSGNPGPGGWAFILRHPESSTELEGSGGDASTTNNKMELLSVIRGLEALDRPSIVELYSDSQYVVNGLNQWLADWKKRDWRTAARKPVKNVELWQRLDELKNIHTLIPRWVKGHNEHPENERCDRMAVAQIERFRRV